MSPRDGLPVEVLLVEDNPSDVELARECMQETKVPNRIHPVPGAEEAIAFLRREGTFAQSPRPDLVLLDLNLPGRSGLELLEEVKSDPDLKTIPVIVLTSSDAEADVAGSYAANANAYVRKPMDLDEFAKVVRFIERFWFSVVRLPSR